MAKGTRDFLDSYAVRRVDAPELFDFYLQLARTWVTSPSYAMPASYGGVLVWSRLCAVLGLGSSLETVLTNDVAAHLLSQEKVFAPMRDGYWLDNYIEQRLADAVADEDDAVNLGFVPDDDLRRIIRRDLMEARTCVEARAFKAALVLAGSVAEALILAAVLAKGTAKSEAALTKMGLKELVAEARALNIVPDEKTMNPWTTGCAPIAT